MSLLVIILLVVVIAAAFGGLNQGRWGYGGWSPLGLILVILLILYLSGNLPLR